MRCSRRLDRWRRDGPWTVVLYGHQPVLGLVFCCHVVLGLTGPVVILDSDPLEVRRDIEDQTHGSSDVDRTDYHVASDSFYYLGFIR